MKKQIGLSLSGGGVKGAAHIGVLKALQEENVEISYISGTSSGSIVAALYAIGYEPNEILETFKINAKKVRYYDLKNVLKLIFGIFVKRKIIIEGLTDGTTIEKLMKEKCIEKNIINIKDTKIPLLIPAVKLHNGEVTFFSSRLTRSSFSDEIKYIDNIDIPSAVRASCSYPGVFVPKKISGNKYIDGGVRENIPWKGLKEIGADTIVSVIFEKTIKEKSKINVVDIIESSLNIMGHELANYELIGENNILKIKTKDVGLLETKKIDELYEIGYEQTKKQIIRYKQKSAQP